MHHQRPANEVNDGAVRELASMKGGIAHVEAYNDDDDVSGIGSQHPSFSQFPNATVYASSAAAQRDQYGADEKSWSRVKMNGDSHQSPSETTSFSSDMGGMQQKHQQHQQQKAFLSNNQATELHASVSGTAQPVMSSSMLPISLQPHPVQPSLPTTAAPPAAVGVTSHRQPAAATITAIATRKTRPLPSLDSKPSQGATESLAASDASLIADVDVSSLPVAEDAQIAEFWSIIDDPALFAATMRQYIEQQEEFDGAHLTQATNSSNDASVLMPAAASAAGTVKGSKVASIMTQAAKRAEQSKQAVLSSWKVESRYAKISDPDVLLVGDEPKCQLRNPGRGKQNSARMASGADDDDEVENMNPGMYTLEMFAKKRVIPLDKNSFLRSVHERPEDRIYFATKLRAPLLLPTSSELASKALKLFHKIVAYAGMTSSSKGSYQHASEIVAIGISAPEALRDEIYVQICKQTRSCPDTDARVRAFTLLSLCTGHFPPSNELAPYLRLYLSQTASAGNNTEVGDEATEEAKAVKAIADIANYALGSLRAVLLTGARVHGASAQEILACEQRMPVIILVAFSKDKSKTMKIAVESHTTSGAVTQAICIQLGITHQSSFSINAILYDKHGNEIQRHIPKYEKVLDVIADVAKQNAQHSRKKKKQNQSQQQQTQAQKQQTKARPKSSKSNSEQEAEVSLRFQARLFLSSNLNTLSDGELSIYFERVVSDFLNGWYPADEAEIMRLAVLQLYAEHGATPDHSYSAGWLVRELPNCIPQELLGKRSSSFLATRMFTELQKFSGRSQREARLEYMRTLQNRSTHGGTFFRAIELVSRKKGAAADSVGGVSGGSGGSGGGGKAGAVLASAASSGAMVTSKGDKYVVLCVSERGLHILDPVNRSEMQLFTYGRIKTFGDADANTLVLTAGTEHHEFRKRFLTNNASEIHGLMQDYIQTLSSSYYDANED